MSSMLFARADRCSIVLAAGLWKLRGPDSLHERLLHWMLVMTAYATTSDTNTAANAARLPAGVAAAPPMRPMIRPTRPPVTVV
jgi:hypothetical protein